MLNSNELGNLPDRELLAESRAYQRKLEGDPAGLNFTNAEAVMVDDLNDSFEAALDAHDAAQMDEDAKLTGKNGLRTQLLAELRRQRNVSYANTGIADETLAGYGLPPRDKVKTASAAPTTAPTGHIDYGKLKHTIHFRDAATPDKKAKPKGMKGCDIYRAIGAPPVSEDDYRYVTNDSDSPHVMFYEMADAGKRVFYLLRWVSNSGEVGEWSETIEATING